MIEQRDCVHFVPLSDYNWGFSNGLSWLPWNPVVLSILVAFSTLAYYISMELFILILVKFKRRSGLYFWSIIASTIGVVLQTTGYILTKMENKCPVVLVLLIMETGWMLNVTGLSLVLYSRLHLVIKDSRILKSILIMIIFNAVVWHGSSVTLKFGLITKYRHEFFPIARIEERMQQTIFATQESFIALLYIYYSCRFFSNEYGPRTRKLIASLVAMQLLVVAMDVLLTVLFFTDKSTLKCMLHPFFYALKLRLEFVVLNMLRGLCKGGLVDSTFPFSETGHNGALSDGKDGVHVLSRSHAPDDIPPRSWSWAEETTSPTGAEGEERVRQRQESEQTMVEDWDGHFTGGPSWKVV